MKQEDMKAEEEIGTSKIEVSLTPCSKHDLAQGLEPHEVINVDDSEQIAEIGQKICDTASLVEGR